MMNIIKEARNLRTIEKFIIFVVVLLVVIASTDTSVAQEDKVSEVTLMAGIEPLMDSYIEERQKFHLEPEKTFVLEVFEEPKEQVDVEISNNQLSDEKDVTMRLTVPSEEEITEIVDVEEQQKEQPKNKKKKNQHKNKTKKQKGFPEYADEEQLLAKIIEFEAGSEKDKIYTGSVIINRARTQYKDFKNVNTIKEVLYQGYNDKSPQQYADTTIQKIESGKKISKESLKIAKGLISGDIECLDESVLYQMQYKMKWAGSYLKDADLPGAHEYYGIPKDFKS